MYCQTETPSFRSFLNFGGSVKLENSNVQVQSQFFREFIRAQESTQDSLFRTPDS